MSDPDDLDRDEILRAAREIVDNPKYDEPPKGDIRITELVRSMRQMEGAAKLARDRPQNSVTPNFALGFWAAMAAIRHEFAIEDARYVDTESDDGD